MLVSGKDADEIYEGACNVVQTKIQQRPRAGLRLVLSPFLPRLLKPCTHPVEEPVGTECSLAEDLNIDEVKTRSCPRAVGSCCIAEVLSMRIVLLKLSQGPLRLIQEVSGLAWPELLRQGTACLPEVV